LFSILALLLVLSIALVAAPAGAADVKVTAQVDKKLGGTVSIDGGPAGLKATAVVDAPGGSLTLTAFPAYAYSPTVSFDTWELSPTLTLASGLLTDTTITVTVADKGKAVAKFHYPESSDVLVIAGTGGTVKAIHPVTKAEVTAAPGSPATVSDVPAGKKVTIEATPTGSPSAFLCWDGDVAKTEKTKTAVTVVGGLLTDYEGNPFERETMIVSAVFVEMTPDALKAASRWFYNVTTGLQDVKVTYILVGETETTYTLAMVWDKRYYYYSNATPPASVHFSMGVTGNGTTATYEKGTNVRIGVESIIDNWYWFPVVLYFGPMHIPGGITEEEHAGASGYGAPYFIGKSWTFMMTMYGLIEPEPVYIHYKVTAVVMDREWCKVCGKLYDSWKITTYASHMWDEENEEWVELPRYLWQPMWTEWWSDSPKAQGMVRSEMYNYAQPMPGPNPENPYDPVPLPRTETRQLVKAKLAK
jgi:hypothetical protein